MRRILLVSSEFPPIPRIGGIASMVGAIAQELDTRRDIDSVWCTPAHPDLCFVRPRGALSNLATQAFNALRLRRFLDQNPVDGVYFMDAAARCYGLPMLPTLDATVYVHGSELMQVPWLAETLGHRQRLERKALSRAQRILVTSHAVHALLPSVLKAKASVRPPCFDASMMPRTPLSPKPQKQAHEPLTILTCARLIKRKGIDFVLHALAAGRERLPSFEYHIAGEGPDRPALEALTAALGLEDCVRFKGVLRGQALIDAYRQADVFVMTSRSMSTEIESFGLVYLEAALQETCSIGTRVGGVSDAVMHGETGMLIDWGDQPGLLKVLEQLLRDHELRARLGVNAREYALSRFSPAAFVDDLLANNPKIMQ